MSSEQLKEAVKVAVRQTLGALAASHPNESLNGYALVTDDDLRAIGHLASTKESTDSEDGDLSRFEPVDWVYDDGVEAFDQARELLQASADAASAGNGFVAHVRESFAALVEALRELKSGRVFDDAVFLTVISTDPSEQLEQLENGAVRDLNSDEIYRRWRASIG